MFLANAVGDEWGIKVVNLPDKLRMRDVVFVWTTNHEALKL